MARTLTKQKPIRQIFNDSIKETLLNVPDELDYNDDVWIEKPVSVQEFCDKYIREALYPEQLKFCEAVVGTDPTEWNLNYDEALAFWGKGGGKDRTIAKLVLYSVYKLMCLHNPQKYLREKYNCSIGDDDAIDIANMSINARQANKVFFKKLKSVLKRCKNPKTGKNWFKEHGVDLREGYDIQKTEIMFTDSISAHSLNSETNTGEGLNLFIVVIDEFGSFPFENAFGLLEATGDTVTSRFPLVGKVAILSFKYYDNDPMETEYKQTKGDERVYRSRKATWQVNIQRSKQDFSRKYSKNPEKAAMTYECKGKSKTGGYIKMKYMLNRMFSPNYENPVKGDLISVKSNYLQTLQFKEWFKGSPGRVYAFRVDGATGKKEEGRDCVGLSIVHCEQMKPRVDPKMKKQLLKEGIMLEEYGDEVTRKGVIIDLAIQIVAESGTEIQLSDLRNFVIRIKEQFKFNIVFGSYDQWQSKDSIQILTTKGFDMKELSVDRTNKPYNDWKELMYQQLVKCYPQDIAHREAKELIIDEKGKVDHPEKSWDRFIMEGVDYGSKDLMDAISGATSDALERIPITADVFFF